MGLGDLRSGQAKACPLIVPRWESSLVPIVLEQVLGGATFAQVESFGPVWRMARAVTLGDLQGAPPVGP